MNLDFELIKKYNNVSFFAGVDEVGRGPLAGPVVAACVLIPDMTLEFVEYLDEMGITDSKKLTTKKRKKFLSNLHIDQLATNKIIEINILSRQVYFSICEISEREIEKINILNASLVAMKNSYFTIGEKYSHKGVLLVDGNKLPKDLPQDLEALSIIKGDSRSVVIALASIIAKEYRDTLMEKMGAKFPGYGLEKHAGYPTKMHREAIKQLGPTIHHRKTFKGVKEYV